jgi:hypothetical protein
MFMIARQSKWALFQITLMMTIILSCSVGRFGTMAKNFPKEINGWSANVEVETYDRKTIFRYIDGGAELYLAYNFRSVNVHTYTKSGEPDIVMDMYEMNTPEDAFGVFTSEREGDDIGIGQGSEYDAGLLRFFKGRFFVSIMTYGETPKTKKTVLDLAREVADSIQSTGRKPELVSSLPSRGLIENSILYFYNPTILNHRYFVASENILQIDEHTEGVLARYMVEDDKLYLLIVRYPTTKHAKMAHKSFLNSYMPDAVQTGVVQTENGKWTATNFHNQSLAVVFDAPSRSSASSLLETVRMQ